MTDASGVRREVRANIEKSCLPPGIEVKDDDDDFLTLGMKDTTGFVELVEELQSRFGVTAEGVEITAENLGSIDATGGYVERKRSAV